MFALIKCFNFYSCLVFLAKYKNLSHYKINHFVQHLQNIQEKIHLTLPSRICLYVCCWIIVATCNVEYLRFARSIHCINLREFCFVK